MIDNFDQKLTEALKTQADSINPERFLMANIVNNTPVTPASEIRYNSVKGRLINELLSFKTLLPIAGIALVIATGFAYESEHTVIAPVQTISEAPNYRASSNSHYQPSSDPDQIYNDLVADSDSEDAASQEEFNQELAALDNYDQSIQELNNAYDENQF